MKCLFYALSAYDMPIVTLSAYDMPILHRYEGSRTSVQRECQGGLYCIYLTTVT